jgi:hypothetical protein
MTKPTDGILREGLGKRDNLIYAADIDVGCLTTSFSLSFASLFSFQQSPAAESPGRRPISISALAPMVVKCDEDRNVRARED